MLRYNEHTRTLEQDEYKYELQDVPTPNLYRDIFSYGEIPKVPFNHRRVPMFPAKEIWVTDTTFRDGQQARPPYTPQQVLDLYDLLHKLGGPNGVIRQCEFFLYSERDKESVRRCMERGYRYPEITAWIRAVKEDFKLVKQMGLRETGILTSASDYHIFLKLRKTRRQAMEMYLDIVKAALDEGIIPRCHFEDITRADFYGFVVPFALELMRLSDRYEMPVKIRACDTLGYGVFYPGASLPRSVPGIIYGLTHLAGVPSEWLEWHGHNDFGVGVANATTAWMYGCSAVNCTLLGIGERTGNVPLELMLIHYVALRGETNGIDTRVITEIAEYYTNKIGYKIPPMQPLVGSEFNLTRAGIHADGLMKNEEIYNIFDTTRLLNRPPAVAITDKSGLAGLAHWVNTYFKLPPERQVPKNHPGLLKMKEWVDEQYAGDRVTSISEEELVTLARQHLPEFCDANTVKSR